MREWASVGKIMAISKETFVGFYILDGIKQNGIVTSIIIIADDFITVLN